VHILSTFGNELIKHKPIKAGDTIHEIKIRVLHKVYKQVFKELYSTIVPRHAKIFILTKRLLRDNKQVAMSQDMK
jgi:hypothetical protein